MKRNRIRILNIVFTFILMTCQSNSMSQTIIPVRDKSIRKCKIAGSLVLYECYKENTIKALNYSGDIVGQYQDTYSIYDFVGNDSLWIILTGHSNGIKVVEYSPVQKKVIRIAIHEFPKLPNYPQLLSENCFIIYSDKTISIYSNFDDKIVVNTKLGEFFPRSNFLYQDSLSGYAVVSFVKDKGWEILKFNEQDNQRNLIDSLLKPIFEISKTKLLLNRKGIYLSKFENGKTNVKLLSSRNNVWSNTLYEFEGFGMVMDADSIQMLLRFGQTFHMVLNK